MTNRYETETIPENGAARSPEQPAPVNSEGVYDLLTGYAFARRYVGGKTVADIGWEEIGYGSRLLAETARSVAGLANSSEAVKRASAVYSAPNVSYQKIDLPKLPHSEGHFDVVVALGVIENLEHPEDLVRELKRVLKRDGILVISTPDKQAYANDRESVDGRREMYIPEFREMLERNFGQVRVYRQGAVAGGFVFPASEEVTGAPLESARFSLASPDLGMDLPTTRSVIAVCGDAETPVQEEQPYLLLDRDRRVFDECEEHAEDVELMRGEIRQMQETEVQAFVDALRVQQSLALVLRRYLIHAFNIIYGNIYAIRRKGVRGVAEGASQRLFGPYPGVVISVISNKGLRGAVRGASRRLLDLYRRSRVENDER